MPPDIVSKPHRWFRFSLRTMFVLLTLACCAMWWVRVQMKWINDRHEAAMLWHYETNIGGTALTGNRIFMEVDGAPAVVTQAPWNIRTFGEPGYRMIWVVPENEASLTATDKEAFRQVTLLFPEAEVSFWSGTREYTDKQYIEKSAAKHGHYPHPALVAH